VPLLEDNPFSWIFLGEELHSCCVRIHF
jgi:hypothetical protein